MHLLVQSKKTNLKVLSIIKQNGLTNGSSSVILKSEISGPIITSQWKSFNCRRGRGLLMSLEMIVRNENLIGYYEKLALLIWRNVPENKFAYILQKRQDVSGLGRNQTSVAT